TNNNALNALNANSSATCVAGPREKKKKRDYSAEFNLWWPHFPRKVSKEKAAKQFSAAIKSICMEHNVNTEDALGWLISRTKAYAQSVIHKNSEHIKHPDGWLADKRFNDEFVTAKDGDFDPYAG